MLRLVLVFLPPPFFPAFNNSIVAGKKGGRGEDRIRLEAVIISSPFFPAFNNSIVAGKKGGEWRADREGKVLRVLPSGRWVPRNQG